MSVLFSVPSVVYLSPFSSEQLLPLTLSTVILSEAKLAKDLAFDSLGPQAPSPALKTLCCHFLNLPELQFHRRCAAKNRDHHFQRLAIFIHFVHRAVEIRKWPISDADSLVLFKLHANLRLVLAHVHAIDDLVDLIFGQRRWIICRPHKTRNTRSRFHHMPYMVAFAAGAEAREVHLHQHVAGIKHPLHGIFLSVADLRHRLRGNHDLADLFSQAKRLDARFQRFLHFALKARITVDDVPLHVRVGVLRRWGLFAFRWSRVDILLSHACQLGFPVFAYRTRWCNTQLMPVAITWSITKKYTPKRMTVIITTVVVA